MAEPTAETWIDVENQLPALGQNVLVAIGSDDFNPIDHDIAYRSSGNRWFERNSSNSLGSQGITVTHWRPLPALPPKPPR